MNDFPSCLFSNYGLAYSTGLVIFLLTLFLVYKRAIGFTLTLLLLLFALAASLAVAHQKEIKEYIDSLSKERPSTSTYKAQGAPSENTENTLTDKLQKAYDDLKEEFEIYKKKLEDYLEQNKEKQTPPEPTKPPKQPPEEQPKSS